MGNLFGKEKKSPSRINDQDRAVLVRNSPKKMKLREIKESIPRNYKYIFFSGIEKTERSATQISKKN